MTTVTHPRTGATLAVPDGWEVLAEADSDTLVVIEPEGSDHVTFRANLVLSAVRNDGMTFRDWQVATDQALPAMLDDYLLLDLERLEVDGRPGGRRLASHVAPGGEAVTMEQWFALVGGVGFTLTATVDTVRYDGLADEVAALVTTLRLPAGGAG